MKYAITGMLSEASDAYSFGVLLMEILTGRSPVDYSRASVEVRIDIILFELCNKLTSCEFLKNAKCSD
ncbi:hypothetical protein LguiA_008943 [Lonicera macranthoides]